MKQLISKIEEVHAFLLDQGLSKGVVSTMLGALRLSDFNELYVDMMTHKRANDWDAIVDMDMSPE